MSVFFLSIRDYVSRTIKTLKITSMPYNNGYINANGNGSCFGMEERTYLVFVWLRWYWENAKEYPKILGIVGA